MMLNVSLSPRNGSKHPLSPATSRCVSRCSQATRTVHSMPKRKTQDSILSSTSPIPEACMRTCSAAFLLLILPYLCFFRAECSPQRPGRNFKFQHPAGWSGDAVKMLLSILHQHLRNGDDLKSGIEEIGSLPPSTVSHKNQHPTNTALAKPDWCHHFQAFIYTLNYGSYSYDPACWECLDWMILSKTLS